MHRMLTIVAAAALTLGPASAAPAPEARAVIALTTGDVQTLRSRIIKGIPALSQHYRKQGTRLRVVAVIHGEAYRFFLKDLTGTPYARDQALKDALPSLHRELQALVEETGIRLEICQAGMRKRGLHTDNLLPFVHPIANAVTGLIDWQNQGYAYVPVE